jgi:hypothetical protein
MARKTATAAPGFEIASEAASLDSLTPGRCERPGRNTERSRVPS